MSAAMAGAKAEAVRLSCYIMTLNAARRLDGALHSVRGLVDDLLVVDSGSTDDTEEIARRHGARFVTRPFDNFTSQRRFCVSQCQHDWVLTIDADEALSEALRDRLLQMKTMLATTEVDAFGIRREWYLLGRRIHCFYPSHCPDQPIRLFRRDSVTYIEGRHVHEAMTGFGRAQSIEEAILHFTGDSVEDIYAKLSLYSSLAAKDALALGKRSSWLKIATLPWALAAKWYFVEGGWKDGAVGIVHALYVRDMVYQKWLKLKWDWEGAPGVPQADASARAGCVRGGAVPPGSTQTGRR